ncbi:MAG: PQQ-binding-like beta-propeller repeat protein [Planctomycetota bacterium]
MHNASIRAALGCAALLTSVCVALARPAASHAAEDWPAFRGPRGDGTSTERSLPLEWSADKNVKWRTQLSRPCNGSPIVAAGRVFLTLAEDDEGKQRSLYCYDREDGKQLWVRTIDFGKQQPTHDTNPYCGTTPASDGERVVVWHGSAGLHAYTLDGEPLWKQELGEFVHMWGDGTSPVIHNGRVYLNTGPDSVVDAGPDAQCLIAAFDLATGKELWRVAEPNHLTPEQVAEKRLAGSWCTPLITRVGARDLVLCTQATRLVAYDAATGEIVWWCNGVAANRGDLTYSSPTLAGDVCVIAGGYVGPLMGVRIDGKGDVTETHRVFYEPEQLSNCASGVYADGHVFLPDMNGILWCIDPKTGAAAWKERVARGGTWGSIVQAAGRLYLMGQGGATVVFEPKADKLRVLATNDLGDLTNATPAISNGEIFLRTHQALYCIAELADAPGAAK